ncbi:hypothetical protein [Maridesulfovibrio sp.]|uniref:hypothetical protein n=1 Tax=Maridesulfovibrio sp. TaxID=2795000 RepID=UPI002A18ABDC|nr:hypothetical protein [Maridesulfovibrio sp.]
MSKNIEGKSITRLMRSLHRDIGFILIGLTLMYCVSGIVLIYRDQGFLKTEQRVEKVISPGLDAGEIKSELRLRKMKIDRQEGSIIYFNNGKYDKITGQVSYTTQKYPAIIEKLNSLHLSPSNSPIHFLGVTYGILLLFLALSSLLMYKAGTRQLRRGITLAATGILAAAAILII